MSAAIYGCFGSDLITTKTRASDLTGTRNQQGLLIGEGICRQHDIWEIPKLGTLMVI
jgi:hypothetical protein